MTGLLLAGALLALFGRPALDEGTRASLELLARSHSGGTRLAWADAPALLTVGVGAGLLAGMLGMGGGVLKVAGMLVIFKIDIILARAVSLTTMFIATFAASGLHERMGHVRWGLVRAMIAPALVGVFAGTFLATVVPRATLTHFFAFFVLFLAFATLAQCFANVDDTADGNDRPLTEASRLGCWGIGGLHGFVAGLLGISGGVVAVPLQQSLVGTSVRSAVANSIVLSAWITGFGSAAAVFSGLRHGDFLLTDVVFASGLIGGGAWIGSQLGARLSGIIPSFFLKLFLVLVSLTAGLLILLR